MNRARFISTLGPASFDYEKMEEMMTLGVATFRINTAHVEIDYISKVRKTIDEIKENNDTEIIPSMLIDLKGPEIRMLTPLGENVQIIQDKEYQIYENGNENLVLNQKGILSTLSKGDTILVNDGRVTFSVLDNNEVYAKVLAINDGIIKNNSRVNIPGKILNLGSLTERDKEFINEGIKNEVEYFALSFVQESKNVDELREIIYEYGGDQFIISKIETSSGVNNIEGIIRSSDMIMIARGDLGVELPLKEVAVIQKRLIKKAHSFGVPSIVATQMLESMVNNETPTRAEVSDITNAILDNADILMLSEETAVGKYPVKAVEYLNDVVKFVESSIKDYETPDEFLGNKVAFSLAKSAKIISGDLESDILVMTKSGNTVKMLSALRPIGKIYVVTPNESLERKMSLFNNVYPIHISDYSGNYEDIIGRIKERGKFRKGKTFIVTSGEGYFIFGGTNDIRVEVVGEFVGRGYPNGESVEGKVTYDPNGEGDILISNSCEYLELHKMFKGIIFNCNPTNSVISSLLKETKCVLKLVSMKHNLEEGDNIFIDSRTGIIYR